MLRRPLGEPGDVPELLQRAADPQQAMAIAIGDICCGGWLPAIFPLLRAGANPDRAIEWAVRAGNVGVTSVCLQQGADRECALQEQQRMADTISVEEYYSEAGQDGKKKGRGCLEEACCGEFF